MGLPKISVQTKIKNRIRQARWAKANPEKIRASRRRSYEKHKEKRKEYSRLWMVEKRSTSEGRIKIKEQFVRWAQNLKQQVIEAYGGKCECCGEAELLFLAIDHIKGGGRRQRKNMKRESSKSFYIWLRKEGYPEGYRVLCHNCNMAVYLNKGICPHKVVSQEQEAIKCYKKYLF